MALRDRPELGVTRPLPLMTALTRPFWTGGAAGSLLIQRCDRCHRLIHPPMLLCPDDHEERLEFVPVSGRGRVETWTENVHSWFDGLPALYIAAYVVLEEDPRARVLTNLVNVDVAEVRFGMAVRVLFETHATDDGEIHLPLFEPDHG